MVNGKLILICQSGGEFEKNDDGTLAYNGGEAQAVTVNSEILFDDLKLKLAQICDLDLKTMSMKYFLPKNMRTLISISNEKDLKRMLDFHVSSVTVDLFVKGNEGFNHDALEINTNRETGIKVAESVNHTSDLSDNTSPALLNNSACDDSDNSIFSPCDSISPMKHTGQCSTNIDASASLSENIKKRKRHIDDKRSPKRKKQILVVNDGIEGNNDDVSVSLKKLIGSWRKGITGVGQDFKNVYDFRDTLQKYAIAHRFVYRLKKNESYRASGICVVEGCPWKIHASQVSGTQSFRIKTLNNLHTCVGQPWKYSHSTKNWLVNIIHESLRDSPHHNPEDIANAILRDFGIELNYMRVLRSIEDVFNKSYNQLPFYCDNIMESNPGSYIKLLTGIDKKFQSIFISLNASINGFRKGCRLLLFLEATSLKSMYQEVLLTATALDGDEGFFPVAFAIVNNENNEKWKWFLEQLQSALPSSESITFVSDREKGLKETVVKVFPNSYHGYSIYHLLNSCERSLKGPFRGEGKAYLPAYFVAAAHATRIIGFKRFTEQIADISSQAYNWIMEIEPECWTTISAKGEGHNQITDNIGELYSNLMEESKELPILKKIDAIIRIITGLISTRKYESNKWIAELTPSKEAKLHEEIVDARGLKVLTLPNNLFEVRDEVTYHVNLDKLECTCLRWQSSGLPCRHAIAVFNCKRKNLYEFCSKYFTVNSFRSIYCDTIKPVLCEHDVVEEGESLVDSLCVLPPTPSKSLNKPR